MVPSYSVPSTLAKIRGSDAPNAGSGWCPACERWAHPGPDPCLGHIPGVAHACCGHGDTKKAYVVLGGDPDQGVHRIERTVTLYGQPAVEFFNLILRNGVRAERGRETRKYAPGDPFTIIST